MKNLKLKHLLTIFYSVVLAATLISCKSTSVVPPTTTETSTTKIVTVTVHDTILETQKDSSYYKAYMECVNGKVVIAQHPKSKPETKKGKYLKPPKVDIKDNVLQVDCLAEAQKLFYQWQEQYIQENKSSVVRIPYPVIQPLTWWQTTQIWSGRIFLNLLLLIAIVTALRLLKVI